MFVHDSVHDLARGHGESCGGASWEVFAFEGLTGHPTDPVRLSYPFVQKAWLPVLRARFRSCTLHYHSESNQAVRAAVRQALAAGSDGSECAPARFVVLGYSNGGHAAIQFAHRLAQRGVVVALGFTADPVAKGLALFRPAREVLVRPPNAQRWVNFYQRTDRSSLARFVPVRGSPVAGADRNEKVDGLGAKAHVRLPGYPQLLMAMSKELKAAGLPSAGFRDATPTGL